MGKKVKFTLELNLKIEEDGILKDVTQEYSQKLGLLAEAIINNHCFPSELPRQIEEQYFQKQKNHLQLRTRVTPCNKDLE